MHRFPIAAKRSSICNPVRAAEAGEAQYINTTDYNTAQYTRLPRTNTATRGTYTYTEGCAILGMISLMLT